MLVSVTHIGLGSHNSLEHRLLSGNVANPNLEEPMVKPNTVHRTHASMC
jgi:hypothetical protein